MKIYDCFIFFNEVELAKLRIDLLYPHVDFICIVEGKQDHRGKPRTLRFDEVLKTLSDTRKIRYLAVDLPDYGLGDLAASYRENYQRDQLIKLLWDNESDDLIFFGDADEIPDPSIIWHAIDLTLRTPCKLEQYLSYYAFNCRAKEKWYGTTAARKWHFTRLTDLRNLTIASIPYIAYAGWHASYCGDVAQIREKLESFCHADAVDAYATEENIRACIESGNDLFARHGDYQFSWQPVDTTYPENIHKFMHLVKEDLC